MSPLRMSALPARTRTELTWQLANDKDLHRVRRGLLQHFTSAHGQDPPAVAAAERIGLVMTELAGNALRHGKPPVLVRLLSDDGCYILDVVDCAPDRLPAQPEQRQNLGAGGRGLRIALSVAQEVCWHVDGDSKHVWASFPLHRTRG
jgi:serine/threonine-protein kinase RsbW